MTTTTSKTSVRAALLAGLAIAAGACNPDQGPLPGQETGPCVEGECLGALMCLSDVCVDPNGDTETQGSGTGGPTTLTATPTASASGSATGTGADTTTGSVLDGSSGPTTDPVTATDTGPDPTSGTTSGTTTMPDPSTSDSMGSSSTGSGEVCAAPAHAPCDGMANNLFEALGVNCPGEPVFNVMSTGSVAAMVTRSSFGGTTQWDPREGSAFAVLGSGFTVDLDMQTPAMDNNMSPTHCNDDLGVMFDPGMPPMPIDIGPVAGDCAADDTLIGTGDCSGSLGTLLGAIVADYTEIRLTADVPPTVTSLSYDFAFFSTEYPFYLGSQFNDIHIAWLESERWTGNIAFDGMGGPISVNSVLLDVQDDAGTAPEFTGTCMRQHAGTSWTQSVAPVAAGETMTLVLAISDVGDSILDSYVFLDNFAWGCSELDTPTTMLAP